MDKNYANTKKKFAMQGFDNYALNDISYYDDDDNNAHQDLNLIPSSNLFLPKCRTHNLLGRLKEDLKLPLKDYKKLDYQLRLVTMPANLRFASQKSKNHQKMKKNEIKSCSLNSLDHDFSNCNAINDHNLKIPETLSSVRLRRSFLKVRTALAFNHVYNTMNSNATAAKQSRINIRRKSCYCKDCGGISEKEKKIGNILLILPDRNDKLDQKHQQQQQQHHIKPVSRSSKPSLHINQIKPTINTTATITTTSIGTLNTEILTDNKALISSLSIDMNLSPPPPLYLDGKSITPTANMISNTIRKSVFQTLNIKRNENNGAYTTTNISNKDLDLLYKTYETSSMTFRTPNSASLMINQNILKSQQDKLSFSDKSIVAYGLRKNKDFQIKQFSGLSPTFHSRITHDVDRNMNINANMNNISTNMQIIDINKRNAFMKKRSSAPFNIMNPKNYLGLYPSNNIQSGNPCKEEKKQNREYYSSQHELIDRRNQSINRIYITNNNNKEKAKQHSGSDSLSPDNNRYLVTDIPLEFPLLSDPIVTTMNTSNSNNPSPKYYFETSRARYETDKSYKGFQKPRVLFEFSSSIKTKSKRSKNKVKDIHIKDTIDILTNISPSQKKSSRHHAQNSLEAIIFTEQEKIFRLPKMIKNVTNSKKNSNQRKKL